jgi:hypothetical protein
MSSSGAIREEVPVVLAFSGSVRSSCSGSLDSGMVGIE